MAQIMGGRTEQLEINQGRMRLEREGELERSDTCSNLSASRRNRRERGEGTDLRTIDRLQNRRRYHRNEW